MSHILIVKIVCMMLDLFHRLPALSQGVLLHLKSHHHEHFFHHLTGKCRIILFFILCFKYAFSSEREGVFSLLYCCGSGSGWENKTIYVSFYLSVDICHPYSFNVTQLFSQMDFIIFGHLIC